MRLGPIAGAAQAQHPSAAPISREDRLGTLPPRLEPGTKVRISTDHTFVGIVAGYDDDSLYLAPPRYGDPSVAVFTESITQIEVSHGRGPGLWIGAGVGMLTGALIGGALASSGQHACESEPCNLGQALAAFDQQAKAGALGIAAGAVTGLLVGAVIGRALSPERWEPVELAPVELSVRPGGGATVSVSLRTRF